jgi:hypothetical protein
MKNKHVLAMTFLICLLTALPVVCAQGDAAQPPAKSQADAFSSSESLILELSKALGPTAFLGWFCYYTVSKTLPAKDVQIESARAAYATEMSKERDDHKEIVNKLVDELKEQRVANLEIVRNCALAHNCEVVKTS